MSINYAILGILSARPMTGYDLKKIIQESPFMPWSGNNNQIYKALLELDNQGYVTNEVQHLEKSPSKKIYTITDDGFMKLKSWLRLSPEAPEYKNLFLVQLAWTDMLNTKEIQTLLDCYEQRVKEQIIIQQKTSEKGSFAPNRTDRETVLWELINDNIISSYFNELKWIERVRQKLDAYPDTENSSTTKKLSKNFEEGETMTYKLIEKDNQKYILLDTIGKPITSEQDGLDLISICVQHDTRNLLIPAERLSDDFLRLSTGVAGVILQKFANYSVKAVTILDEAKTKGMFKQFVTESNQGTMFRVYRTFEEAEQWLLSYKSI